MKIWTLADLRDKVRRLTGRLTPAQVSDADLDAFINHYYVNTLAAEAPHLPFLKSWWEQEASPGVDTYDIPEDYLVLTEPFYIAGAPAAWFTTDPAAFYSRFPQDQAEASGKPDSVLFFDRQVILRPVPDQAYTLKGLALQAPAALLNATDQPLAHQLGLLIAYGAAIDLLLEHGQAEEAASLGSMYERLLVTCTRPALLQLMQQRPAPRF